MQESNAFMVLNLYLEWNPFKILCHYHLCFCSSNSMPFIFKKRKPRTKESDYKKQLLSTCPSILILASDLDAQGQDVYYRSGVKKTSPHSVSCLVICCDIHLEDELIFQGDGIDRNSN